VIKSADGIEWTMIPGSPACTGLAGDGTTLFASNRYGSQAVWTSTGDFSTWTPYESPASATGGAWIMRYDRDHNLLYSTNSTSGFWRVKTK
jgi:hypothetical protein